MKNGPVLILKKIFFYVSFDEPVVLKPGDVLRTTCHFATPNHNTTVFNGDGTREEMCYGFLTFYPVQNMPHHTCITWKSITLDKCDAASYQGCNFTTFQDAAAFSTSEIFANIMGVCDVSACVRVCVYVCVCACVCVCVCVCVLSLIHI